MKLIGIAGRRRSGKDTAAMALLEQGYALIRFTDPLKRMIRSLLRDTGIDINALNNFVEGDQKETPLGALCGKSTRFAMQTLGTEWGRKTLGQDIWIRVALNRAAGLPAAVISDVRFPNEVEAIQRVGGTVIHLTRPEQPLYIDGADGHSSEADTDLIKPDFVVINNSTIEDLQKKILAIAKNL